MSDEIPEPQPAQTEVQEGTDPDGQPVRHVQSSPCPMTWDFLEAQGSDGQRYTICRFYSPTGEYDVYLTDNSLRALGKTMVRLADRPKPQPQLEVVRPPLLAPDGKTLVPGA